MTSIALFGISQKNRNIQGILILLMQNKAKVVATRFLVRIAGRLHRPSVDIDVFLELVFMKLRVYLLTLLLDNTHTNK